jgi:hypothetical protein
MVVLLLLLVVLLVLLLLGKHHDSISLTRSSNGVANFWHLPACQICHLPPFATAAATSCGSPILLIMLLRLLLLAASPSLALLPGSRGWLGTPAPPAAAEEG